MDEPVRSRLRPARHRGLTRPDPVTALPRPQRPPASTFPSRRPGQAAEHVSGGTATPGNTIKIIYRPAGTARRATEFTRWIEAKLSGFPGISGTRCSRLRRRCWPGTGGWPPARGTTPGGSTGPISGDRSPRPAAVRWGGCWVLAGYAQRVADDALGAYVLAGREAGSAKTWMTCTELSGCPSQQPVRASSAEPVPRGWVMRQVE